MDKDRLARMPEDLGVSNSGPWDCDGCSTYPELLAERDEALRELEGCGDYTSRMKRGIVLAGMENDCPDQRGWRALCEVAVRSGDDWKARVETVEGESHANREERDEARELARAFFSSAIASQGGWFEQDREEVRARYLARYPWLAESP